MKTKAFLGLASLMSLMTVLVTLAPAANANPYWGNGYNNGWRAREIRHIEHRQFERRLHERRAFMRARGW